MVGLLELSAQNLKQIWIMDKVDSMWEQMVHVSGEMKILGKNQN